MKSETLFLLVYKNIWNDIESVSELTRINERAIKWRFLRYNNKYFNSRRIILRLIMHYKFSKTFEYYVDCYVEADTLEEALEIANSNEAEWDSVDKPYCTLRNYYEAVNEDEAESEDDLEYDFIDELTYEQLP